MSSPRLTIHTSFVNMSLLIQAAIDLPPEKRTDFLQAEKAHLLEDDNQWSMLHWVARSSNRESLIKPLLQAGASLDDRDKLGDTSLQRAILCCNVEFIRHYIAELNGLSSTNFHKATRDLCDVDGLTYSPLNYAVKFSTEPVCRLLIDSGADLEASEGYGQTPLLNSVIRKEPALCHLLLKAGADLSAKDNSGSSALHLASLHYHFDVSALLLSQGISTDVKDNFGRTPEQYAKSSGNHSWIASLDAWKASKQAQSVIEKLMSKTIRVCP